MIGRLAALTVTYARDLSRRRVAMVLLVALPLGFYFSSAGLEGSFVLIVGGIGLGMAVTGAGLFVSLGSRSLAPRLALVGYGPGSILTGQLIMLLAFSVPLVALFCGVVLIGSEPDYPATFVLGVALTALIAAPLGLWLGSMVPGELEGTLGLIGILGIQMSVPVTAGLAPFLPFYGPALLIERAYGTQVDTSGAGVHAVGAVVVLVVLASVFWVRRVGVDRSLVAGADNVPVVP